MEYKGLVPILPLFLQFAKTLWVLLAPQLALCVLLIPWGHFRLAAILGLLAWVWRVYDEIGREIWPRFVKRSPLVGIYGGAEGRLDVQRRALKQVAATYNPCCWLWGGDQRTLAVAASGVHLDEVLETHRLSGDRGELLLYMRSCEHDEERPLVFVVGGIVGDPDSPFIQHMQSATQKKGWGFALWVTRPDLLPGTLCSAPNPADTSDIHCCLKFVRQLYPRRAIHLVGYSMGASMVLMYCAKYGNDAVCTAAASVSGSFTPLPLYCKHYRQYWQPWLTAQLKLLFYARFEKELPCRDTVKHASTYAQLIDCLPHIGPVSKLCDELDMTDIRHNISKPLLFFASADDPFHHPIAGLGIDPSIASVLYYVTDVGGHVSWPEGWSADSTQFHTRVVLTFFEAS